MVEIDVGCVPSEASPDIEQVFERQQAHVAGKLYTAL